MQGTLAAAASGPLDYHHRDEEDTPVPPRPHVPPAFRRFVFGTTGRIVAPTLSPAHEQALIRRVQVEGDADAAHELLRRFTNFLTGIARAIQHQTPKELDADEMLARAAEEFLYTVTHRYSPEPRDGSSNPPRLYALVRMRVAGALKRYAMDADAPVRTSTNQHLRTALTHLGRIQKAFRARTGRALTDIPDDLRDACAHYTGADIHPDKLGQALTMTHVHQRLSVDSIDIVDPSQDSRPETAAVQARMRADMHTHVAAIARSLSVRNRAIFLALVRDPFEDTVSRKALADRHNLTPERIGQIYRAGLTQLRKRLEEAGYGPEDLV
mgnify:CR=1 FL=1